MACKPYFLLTQADFKLFRTLVLLVMIVQIYLRGCLRANFRVLHYYFNNLFCHFYLLSRQKKWAMLLLFFSVGMVYGQNPIGLPNIVNYQRSSYNGGLQNRGIAQDKNGILYFANSEGLLSFDGTYWKLYQLPNQTIVRSVLVDKDGKIYVGGQNELGYFSPDKDGNLVFTSLKKLLPAGDIIFKDVWDIIAYDNAIFFRSQTHILRLSKGTITDFKPASQWQFLGLCKNQLFAKDAEKGLLTFSGNRWSAVQVSTAGHQKTPVTALLSLSKDSILIASLKDGLYILSDNKISPFYFKGNDPLKGDRILSAMLMPDHHIALGTQLGGLYIVDRQGHIIQNLSRKDGLQNNTILSLFIDKDLNLWMGLDNGIDFYAYNSAVKHIYPERLNEGTGYSALVFNKNLYIGTSNALYSLPVGDQKDLSLINGAFKEVENTKGPVWGLYDADDHLLMAHHEGAFEVKDNRAFPITTKTGYWNFIPFTDQSNSFSLLAGSYNGLEKVAFRQGAFHSIGSVPFNESSRFVEIEKNTAWVAHNYRGIYKIDLANPSAPIHLYTDKTGLPSLLKNHVFRVKKQLVVATSKGIYTYNNRKDVFEPSAYFKNIFGQKDLRYLKEDKLGNIWFIEGKKLGVADFSETKPKIIYFPELDGELVTDFENIYPLNDENVFVGAQKGFYHIDYQQYKANRTPLNVLIRQVKAYGDADSLLNGGYANRISVNIPELKSTESSLHFEFAAPSFQKQASIEYSYRLKNFDQNWSAWSKKTEKDYTNLSHGHYEFEVKARSNLGDESAVKTYAFAVLPPWYLTYWAYTVYGLLFIAVNYLIYRLLKRKFRLQEIRYEEEQKRQNYLHQLEMDKSEKEIIALKNEKLESEILGKNSELASIAMHLLQKGELLTKIRDEMVHLRKSATDVPSEELKKLIRILNQESKLDNEWDQFAAYFDTTNDDFLKAVKEHHPVLSANELKLCAYLKMNLSTKEIAQLLNISVRGVEISRYRLRKKLQLPTEVNLHSYFTDISLRKKDSI